MIKIGIDANEANTNQRVGSNIFAHQIVNALSQNNAEDKFNLYLKQPPKADLPPETKNWHYRTFGPQKLWTQWRLPLDLYFHFPRPNIFFTPGHYAPRFSPVPTAITILDLAFLMYPKAFKPAVLRQLKSWTNYSVHNASHIFAISEHTKKDIVHHYHIPADKISVAYPGSNLKIQTKLDRTSETLTKLQIPPNYLLFIGTHQPRKNLRRLIEAFRPVAAKHPDLFLVLVGKTWHQFADHDLPDCPNIISTGYLDDQDLMPLMLGAKALVFPSLYEGFGIPVLEAMKLGVLVTAANTSSIPEITGDSAILFDPLHTGAISNALFQTLSIPLEKRQTLIKQAKIKAQQFTWEKSAQTILEVLHELSIQRPHG
jgi:glycosyltransferase involved in cell wall biosynthesis